MQEHVKNTYLPTKLLSRVADNCRNTSAVWCESMYGYFPADITQTICLYPDTYCIFKSCKKITFIFNNAGKTN